MHTDALRKQLAAQECRSSTPACNTPKSPTPRSAPTTPAPPRACRYLLELGHLHIRLVAGAVGAERPGQRPHRRRAASAGRARLNLSPQWLADVPYRLDDARLTANRQLSAPETPTAIVCGNDVIAYGVMMEAERMGWTVPEQLSLMGFDDLEWSRHLRPSLTTMHVPIDEIWTRAGKHLVQMLARQIGHLHHEVDVSLVVRDSTGRPWNR